MASDSCGRVQPQLAENGLSSSSRMIFSDEAIHFSRAGVGDHSAPRKPGAASGFEIDGDQSRFVRAQCGSRNPRWNLDGGSQSEGSDGEDDDDVDDDDDFDEGDGLVSLEENNNFKNGNNSSGSVQSSSEKGNGEKARNLQERPSSFVLSRGITGKDGNLNEQEQEQQQQRERVGNYENAITAVHPHLSSAQMTNGEDASSSKETRGDNGYGFSGRKEVGMADAPGESLRTHLLDPITSILMDDAMILPCGHSFGGGGMQHVYKMRACYKCSRPILDNSARPNLALRAAVQAFCREEESQSSKAPKRKRDRFEQERFSYDDPYAMDSRGKGVQFPFVVSDRVIIKGNKRTPQRFVGRVAVVTTQCLNGWYVVKTLDNAESVKLQYRSLARVADDSPPPSNTMQNKPVAPSWL